MANNLVQQGITLMLAGMGTVFVFLTTLVIAMTLMSAAVRRWLPATESAAPRDSADEEVAAISAAIHHHKQNNH